MLKKPEPAVMAPTLADVAIAGRRIPRYSGYPLCHGRAVVGNGHGTRSSDSGTPSSLRCRSPSRLRVLSGQGWVGLAAGYLRVFIYMKPQNIFLILLLLENLMKKGYPMRQQRGNCYRKRRISREIYDRRAIRTRLTEMRGNASHARRSEWAVGAFGGGITGREGPEPGVSITNRAAATCWILPRSHSPRPTTGSSRLC
jgi:hypothetical protein